MDTTRTGGSDLNADEYRDKVFLPEIRTEAGRINVGTVFLVEFEGEPFFVTALHLFGPGGGLKRTIPTEALSGEVSLVQLHDAVTDEVVYDGLVPIDTDFGEPLSPVSDAPDASGDIVVFQSPEQPFGQPLQLRDDPGPNAGDTLYLVSYQRTVSGGGLGRFRLKLIDSTDEFFVMELEDSVDLYGMSGAPIVDEDGLVVSMGVGGLTDPRGRERHLGVPLVGLRSYLGRVMELM